jgi:hypothetical protein
MKLSHLTIARAALNLVVLGIALTRSRPVEAQSVPAVLRAHSLEIVDTQGRVRASRPGLPGLPAHVPSAEWKLSRSVTCTPGLPSVRPIRGSARHQVNLNECELVCLVRPA